MEIREEANIGFHYGNTAHRQENDKEIFKGTFLIQGFFFAHEKEPTMITKPGAWYAGDVDPLYKHPKKEVAEKNQVWIRNPNYSL
ncbi:MAG: hypothetical protein JWN78_412 [Bacteroidota bacterium]|nr:hypothetical protein [Bacteroidota bacterium]